MKAQEGQRGPALDPPFSGTGGPARPWKSLDYSPHNERPGSAGSAPPRPPLTLTHADSSIIAEGLFWGDVRQRSCFRELWEETEGRPGSETLFRAHAATVCVTSSEVTEVNTRDETTQMRSTGGKEPTF